MTKIAIFFLVLGCLLLAMQLLATAMGWDRLAPPYPVRVIAGEHHG